jgi:serine/threonine protein kinase
MAQQKAVEPAVDEVDDLIDELQPGAKLLKGQYTITRYLNSGGFGITYLAKDSLDRDVVIKECFPSSVCRRSKVMVAARSRAHTAELRSVIQLFVREARNLAKIVHPNIVSVHNVFEDNGTAYMALDYIDGLDLQQIIDGEGDRLTPEQIVEITGKLIKAVDFIHAHDMLHRDISPDNVLITKTGEPILIDFGAARDKASQTNRAMSALRVVKDGYSPQEFYIAGSEQGPWSDLYALGATLYHLISHEAPVNGQARLGALAEDRPDPYLPLMGRFPGYPNGFLDAIDKAMSTLPKQRLQSAAEWLAMYEGNDLAPVALSEPVPGTEDAVQRLVSDFQREEARIEAVTAAAIPMATPALAKSASKPAVPATPPRGRSPAHLLAGVALAIVAVAGGYMMLGGRPASVENTRDVTPAADTAATTEAPAAATATASTTTPAPDADPAPSDTAAEATAPAETAAAPAATSDIATAPTEPEATAETAAEPAAPTDTAETEAQATEVAEPEADESAAAEAPLAEPEAAAPVAPAGTPLANQIAFAAWDVELPFSADDRIIAGQPTTIVLRLAPKVDLASAGDWLQPGLLIYSVNGAPTPTSNGLTAGILNAMQVDPDGKARLVVEYAGSDLEKKTGLLTVSAVRLVSMVNGVSVRTAVVDGVWTSTVSGIIKPEVTTLRQGDVLFRDKTTGIPLDNPDALEAVLKGLVAAGTTQTEFSIIRDTKVSSAVLQLAVDGGQ